MNAKQKWEDHAKNCEVCNLAPFDNKFCKSGWTLFWESIPTQKTAEKEGKIVNCLYHGVK